MILLMSLVECVNYVTGGGWVTKRLLLKMSEWGRLTERTVVSDWVSLCDRGRRGMSDFENEMVDIEKWMGNNWVDQGIK